MILLGDCRILDQNEIFGVVLLSRLREIEATGNHCPPVHDQGLVCERWRERNR